MYAGVDEAGRGPVLGPLVVAGVLGRPEDVPDGVADSKKLTPAKRETLFEAIAATPTLRTHVVPIEASALNERMRAGESLNVIETTAFTETLAALGASHAVVDTIGPRPDRFGALLTERLAGRCQVEARVKADASDPLVAAASIVAKVTRDRAMAAIEASYGEPCGSGYASDPATRAFLKTWRARSPEPPPHTRTAWSTVAALGFGTRSLFDFNTPPGGSK